MKATLVRRTVASAWVLALGAACAVAACGGTAGVATTAVASPEPIATTPIERAAEPSPVAVPEATTERLDDPVVPRVSLLSVANSLRALRRDRPRDELWVVVRAGAPVTLGLLSNLRVIWVASEPFAVRLREVPSDQGQVTFQLSNLSVTTLPQGCSTEPPMRVVQYPEPVDQDLTLEGAPISVFASVSRLDLVAVIDHDVEVPTSAGDAVRLPRGTLVEVVDGAVELRGPVLSRRFDASVLATLPIAYGFTCEQGRCGSQEADVCNRSLELAGLGMTMGATSEWGGQDGADGDLVSGDETLPHPERNAAPSRARAPRLRAQRIAADMSLLDASRMPFAVVEDDFEVWLPRGTRPGAPICFTLELSAAFMGDELRVDVCAHPRDP